MCNTHAKITMHYCLRIAGNNALYMRIQVVLTALVISYKGGEKSGNAKEGNSPIAGILMPGLLIKKPRPWSET